MGNASMTERTTMQRLAMLAVCVSLTSLVAARAHADGMGRGLGAMQGAIIGDMIGGSGGAAVGAAVGAMIGAEGQVSREQEYLDQQKAAVDARLAQWETEQQQRELEAREREERTAYFESLAPGIDLDLLLDVQLELMERGYDIGVVGTQSAELTTAIVRYQESQSLAPDGAITPRLLEHMQNEAD